MDQTGPGKPWKPGQSGNPKGRAKGTGQLDWCREYCLKKGKARLIHWAESTNSKASMQALQLMFAYGFGKPVEHHDIAGHLTIEQILGESHQ